MEEMEECERRRSFGVPGLDQRHSLNASLLHLLPLLIEILLGIQKPIPRPLQFRVLPDPHRPLLQLPLILLPPPLRSHLPPVTGDLPLLLLNLPAQFAHAFLLLLVALLLLDDGDVLADVVLEPLVDAVEHHVHAAVAVVEVGGQGVVFGTGGEIALVEVEGGVGGEAGERGGVGEFELRDVGGDFEVEEVGLLAGGVVGEGAAGDEGGTFGHYRFKLHGTCVGWLSTGRCGQSPQPGLPRRVQRPTSAVRCCSLPHAHLHSRLPLRPFTGTGHLPPPHSARHGGGRPLTAAQTHSAGQHHPRLHPQNRPHHLPGHPLGGFPPRPLPPGSHPQSRQRSQGAALPTLTDPPSFTHYPVSTPELVHDQSLMQQRLQISCMSVSPSLAVVMLLPASRRGQLGESRSRLKSSKVERRGLGSGRGRALVERVLSGELVFRGWEWECGITVGVSLSLWVWVVWVWVVLLWWLWLERQRGVPGVQVGLGTVGEGYLLGMVQTLGEAVGLLLGGVRSGLMMAVQCVSFLGEILSILEGSTTLLEYC